MRRADGAVMTSGEMEETIAKQAETIRVLNVQLDNAQDYIRKLESGFERVEAGSWESGSEIDFERLPV